MTKKTTNSEIENKIDSWLKIENKGNFKIALERASRVFDNNDAYTVNTLESIFGQETSFGTIMAKIKGSNGPSGYFQIQKATAEKYSKLKITKANDPRFDIDNSSIYAALYLVDLNKSFSRNTILTDSISTIAVSDIRERKLFGIAAYNAGEGTIARAQAATQKDGEDPTKWNVVKNYLKKIGLSDAKIKEITEYVELVISYEEIFAKKSKADKKLKDKEPLKLSEEGTHWITLKDGRHVFIGDKKA